MAALVQQCAPRVGEVTMLAIIKTESGGNPWAIGDNTSGRSYRLPTKQAAVAAANELIAAGHNLDLGLGQINTSNLGALRLSVDQVFEPCTNVTAAATVLSWGYERARRTYGAGQQALHAAISAYNTGSLSRGFANGYVQKVVSNAGLRVELAVPSVTAGSIVRGKGGAVRVGAGGRLTPYTAPLVSSTWQVAAAEASTAGATGGDEAAHGGRLGQLVPASFSPAP
ncbi:lytic transglycosylase domain-containing protein [Ralstonia thomasii]|uniref:lytic transglycosylase domain-containing protein n=1 Tax=Ralstonia thomasii TaxID=3058596 RepID=UPI003C2F4BDF